MESEMKREILQDTPKENQIIIRDYFKNQYSTEL